MSGMLVIAGKPSGDTDDSGPCTNQVAVSKEALAIDDALPKVGDEVDFQAAGKVVKIDGDNYIVEVTSANDKPVQDADDDDAETEGDPGAERKAALDSFTNQEQDDAS